MDEPTEREPCPHCAEPIAAEARVCPHCRRDVLFDVRLDGPVADGRQRYQAARALAALGAPVPPLTELQSRLGSARPELARGVSRAQARQVQQAVASHGLRGVVTPSGGGPSRAGAGRPAWLLPVAGVAVVGVLAAAGWAFLARRNADAGATAGAAPVRVAAGGGPPAAAALTTPQIAQRALPGTALLRCAGSLGTGFFVSADTLLTNAHVACPIGDTMKVILKHGREAPGTIVKSDVEVDLALVRVATLQGEPLPLGDAGQLTVGDRVVLVGNPMGLEFTVHEGIVSSLSRSILGVAYVQLDAKINPGNSGGPVLDGQGRVVGVVSMKHPQAEGLGLALPINYAFADQRDFVAGAPSASAGFQAMLARVEDDERKQAGEVSDLLASARGIFLGDGKVDQYGRLVVQVFEASNAPLGPHPVTFKFWNGEAEACSAKVDIPRWDVMETGGPNERISTWLNKHGLGLRLYRGDATFSVEPFCGRTAVHRGTVIELVGAHPEASRGMLE
jgi:S1-C subfamily serine protease